MHADALLCSHPRSGGRWLRYLSAHCLAAHYQLGCEVTPQNVFSLVPDHHDEPARGYPAFGFRDHPGLPLVAVCHQPFSVALHRGYPTIFLARNAYDVVVSAYFHLTQKKESYAGSLREFVHHPKLGVPAWIDYTNAWAPKLLNHRDAVLISYRELSCDPGLALRRVLVFLDQAADSVHIEAAVHTANVLRSARGIRTGQEGNFWDHLQPEEIFEVQTLVRRDLSDFSVHLLESMGVEIDPFPRSSP
jgi:hypothetical protein